MSIPYGEKIALALAFPYENYRFASEVLHGTLYSLAHEVGITAVGRPASHEEHDGYKHASICKLLLTLSNAIGQSAIAFAEEEEQTTVAEKVAATRTAFVEKYRQLNPRDDGEVRV